MKPIIDSTSHLFMELQFTYKLSADFGADTVLQQDFMIPMLVRMPMVLNSVNKLFHDSLPPGDIGIFIFPRVFVLKPWFS